MHTIYIISCILLILGCHAEDIKQSKRTSRSIALNPLNLLPFNLFGKTAVVAPVVVKTVPPVITPITNPLTQHAELPLNLPIWKVHKYNGINLKPVSLSSIPYVQVPLPSPPVKQGLPSLSKIMSLLGTSSAAETLTAIKEIASTRDGLRLIANFVKSGLNRPQMTDQQVGSLISNYQFSVPAQEVAQIPSHKVLPIHYGPPIQKYGPPPPTHPLPPQTAYGVPNKLIPPPVSESFTTYSLPKENSEQQVNFASTGTNENSLELDQNQETAGFSNTQQNGLPLQAYPPPQQKYPPPPHATYGVPIPTPVLNHFQLPTTYGLPVPHSEQKVNFASSSADENILESDQNQEIAGFSNVNQFDNSVTKPLSNVYGTPNIPVSINIGGNSKIDISSESMTVSDSLDNTALSEQNSMSSIETNDQQSAFREPAKTYGTPSRFAISDSDSSNFVTGSEETVSDSLDIDAQSEQNSMSSLQVDNRNTEAMVFSDSFSTNSQSEENSMSSLLADNKNTAFVEPAKTYGTPNHHVASVSESQSDQSQIGLGQNQATSNFNSGSQYQNFPNTYGVPNKNEISDNGSSFIVKAQPMLVADTLNDNSQSLNLPSVSLSKSPFKEHYPVVTYGPPKNTYGLPLTSAKTDFADSSSGKITDTNEMTGAGAIDNNAQVFILPSEDSKSSFKAEVPSPTYGIPSKTYNAPQAATQTDAVGTSSGFIADSNAMSVSDTFDNSAQVLTNPSEGNKVSFKVDTPTIVYGTPVSGTYAPQQAPVSFSTGSQDGNNPIFTALPQDNQKIFNDDQINTFSAPTQVYGQPQPASPTQSTFVDSQSNINNNFAQQSQDSFGPIYSTAQTSATQYGNPFPNAVPFAQTYPGYEPTPVSMDIQKAVGGFPQMYLPFPILPKLPYLPDAENLAASQLGSGLFNKISPVDSGLVASAYTNTPSFSLVSGPQQTQNYQQAGFVPSGEPNKYLYAVQRSSLTTGIPENDVSVTSFVTRGLDGRPVGSLNYDHPNFSYTQLSKIPLENSQRHFYKYPGQVSSYGDAISSHIFQGDSSPSASEERPVIVLPEKLKEVKQADNDTISKAHIPIPTAKASATIPAVKVPAIVAKNDKKMIVEQKSVVVSNNPHKHKYERRPWKPLSQRRTTEQRPDAPLDTTSPRTPFTPKKRN